MLPEFQNLALECWLHDGPRLGVSDKCVCLKAESAACQTFVRALDELSAMTPRAKLAIGLEPSGRRGACSTIRLRLSLESDDLRQMHLSQDNGHAVFEFTPRGLALFREAVLLWQNGGEDFSIYPRGPKHQLGVRDIASSEVWFWNYMEP